MLIAHSPNTGQNLANKRLVELNMRFSDTSFPIRQLRNVRFYEWKALPMTIMVDNYDNVLHENVPIYEG